MSRKTKKDCFSEKDQEMSLLRTAVEEWDPEPQHAVIGYSSGDDSSQDTSQRSLQAVLEDIYASGKKLLNHDAFDMKSAIFKLLTLTKREQSVEDSQPTSESSYSKVEKMMRLLIPQNANKDCVCPTVDVEIRGHRVKALIDSGTSVNLIKLSTAESIGLKPTGHQTTLSLGSRSHTMNAIGCVTSCVIVNGSQYFLKFLVCADMRREMILGLPFMTLHRRVTFYGRSVNRVFAIRPSEYIFAICLDCCTLQVYSAETDKLTQCRKCCTSYYLRRVGSHLHSIFVRSGLWGATIPVKVNGRTFSALVDSGAGESAMRGSVASMLKLRPTGPIYRARLASEKCFSTVIGHVVATMTVKSRKFHLIFAVQNGMDEELILGIDFLQLHREAYFQLNGTRSPFAMSYVETEGYEVLPNRPVIVATEELYPEKWTLSRINYLQPK